MMHYNRLLFTEYFYFKYILSVLTLWYYYFFLPTGSQYLPHPCAKYYMNIYKYLNSFFV